MQGRKMGKSKSPSSDKDREHLARGINRVTSKRDMSSGRRRVLTTSVAERIDWLRDTCGKEFLGEKRRTQLYDYASGRRAPGVEILQAIVAATGCNGHWLLTGEGDPFPPPDPRADEAREFLDVLSDGARALNATAAVITDVTDKLRAGDIITISDDSASLGAGDVEDAGDSRERMQAAIDRIRRVADALQNQPTTPPDEPRRPHPPRRKPGRTTEPGPRA